MKTSEQKLEAKKYLKSLTKKRLSEGKCASCNEKSAPPSIYCEYHLIERRKWESDRRKIRVKNGGCGSCATGIHIENIKICIDCWWQTKAVSIFNSIKYIPLLKELWDKQNGLCALSGLPLIPGTNASIDHIIPKSKGGTKDLSNLRWVLTSVNNGKHDLDDEEFIKICKAIVLHNKK